MSETETFTDGLWHSVNVDIESGGSDRVGKINITIDGRSDTSNRQLSFTTTEHYYIGGEALTGTAQERDNDFAKIGPKSCTSNIAKTRS